MSAENMLADAVNGLSKTMAVSSGSAREQYLRGQIKQMEDKIYAIEKAQRSLTAGDVERMDAIQRRADQVLVQFGERSPTPMVGETPVRYQQRVVEAVAKRSPTYEGTHTFGIGSQAALDEMERHVFADAQAAAHRQMNNKPGILVPVQERDHAGRLVTKYIGDPGCWMSQFMTGGVSGSFKDPGPGARYR